MDVEVPEGLRNTIEFLTDTTPKVHDSLVRPSLLGIYKLMCGGVDEMRVAWVLYFVKLMWLEEVGIKVNQFAEVLISD